MSKEEFNKHPIKASIFMILSLIFFIGLVWFGVSMATTEVPDMEHVFQNTAMYAVMLGIPLVITIGLTNYFDKGDKKRLIFGLISTGVLIAYFVMVLGSINLGFEGEEFTYTLTITGIIVLTVMACAVRGIFYALEFYIYQKEINGKKAQKDHQSEPQYY